MNQDPGPMTRQGLVRALGQVRVQELAGKRQDARCTASMVMTSMSSRNAFFGQKSAILDRGRA